MDEVERWRRIRSRDMALVAFVLLAWPRSRRGQGQQTHNAPSTSQLRTPDSKLDTIFRSQHHISLRIPIHRIQADKPDVGRSERFQERIILVGPVDAAVLA